MKGDPFDAPFKPSRSALRSYYGSRSIVSNGPENNPRNGNPTGGVGSQANRNLDTGLTRDDVWNDFFKRGNADASAPKPNPAADVAAKAERDRLMAGPQFMQRLPNAISDVPTGGSSAPMPESAPDAPAMAGALSDADWSQPGAWNPQQIHDQTIQRASTSMKRFGTSDSAKGTLSILASSYQSPFDEPLDI